jgi:hypothetical protein
LSDRPLIYSTVISRSKFRKCNSFQPGDNLYRKLEKDGSIQINEMRKLNEEFAFVAFLKVPDRPIGV